MSYRIQTLTREEAKQILRWRYPAPFDFYDPPDHMEPDVLISQFLLPENGFHGVRDIQNAFVGFCSFGLDGQVSGGDYIDDALDIGLGMKPELTNRGSGEAFTRAIVAFAESVLLANKLRLTVANFNTRAVKVYQKCGFRPVQQFNDTLGEPHTVMVMSASSSIS